MLSLFILVPLVCLLVLNLPWRVGVSKVALALGVLLSAIQVVVVLMNPQDLWGQGPEWLSSILPGLRVDYIARLLLLTIGVVTLSAFLVGRPTISEESSRINFANLALVALVGMNGMVLVQDIFSLYVFLEVTAIASFVLIALHRGRSALEGAFKYLVLSAVASILMLTAVALLMMTAGGTGFAAVHKAFTATHGELLTKVALAAFVCGLFIKGGMVPFHGWLPGAYSTAPAAVSVLLAGIVTKVSGIYALIRLVVSVFDINTPGLNAIILVVATISVIIGALAALTQTDFKKVLAYSSISQVGYILLGLGCGTKLGLIGALFHFFNHAVFKSLLFVNSAAVEKSTGTTDMRNLGGLSSRMPVTGATNLLAMLSTAGVPPLAGFWSKLLIIVALWLAGFYALAVVAILVSVLTLAYLLLIQRRVFFGKTPAELQSVKEAPGGLKLAQLLLGAITVGVGVAVPFVPQAIEYIKSVVL